MHVAVIGAGVFGTWTAHHLLAAGAAVTLIDADGPAHSRSSSGDETRILRCGYGTERVYSEFACRSLHQWRELDRRLRPHQAPIWHPCGVLWIAAADDAYVAATIETLRTIGYRMDVLTDAMVRARFPDLRAEDGTVALFEPEAGMLMARRSVQALAADLQRRGVRVLRGHVPPPDPPRNGKAAMKTVSVDDGTNVSAEAFVFACGAWLGRVFPDPLGAVIRPTRQVVVYFGTPAGDRFSASRMPAWIARPGVYGIPDVEGRTVKVGIHEPGPPMDPDSDDRRVDAASVEIARRWLAHYMPALADAPVVESRVCQYENTDTGDFVIDRHPAYDNVWIVGGGSGHGFKHGPAVGELVARLVTTGAATDTRFSLASRTMAARRAVY